MNCSKCGQPQEPGAAFCGNCGQAFLPQNVVAAPVVSMPEAVIVPAPASAVGPTPQAQMASPIAQVYNNQPAFAQPTPPAPQIFMAPPNPGMPVTGGAVPAYAIAQPHPHHTKATLSVVFGAIGIVTSLLPIIGLAFGIAGLVLGTLTSRLIARKLKIIGIILSSLAIVLSLGVWVFAATLLSNQHSQQSAKRAATSSAPVVASSNLATDCYSLGFNGSLNIQNDTGSCDMRAFNGSTFDASTEVYKILATQSASSLTSQNFTAVAKSALESDIQKSLPGYTISSEGAGTFADSPLYSVSAQDASQANTITEAAVFHATAQGDNFFVIVHGKSGTAANLQDLAAHWVWK